MKGDSLKTLTLHKNGICRYSTGNQYAPDEAAPHWSAQIDARGDGWDRGESKWIGFAYVAEGNAITEELRTERTFDRPEDALVALNALLAPHATLVVRCIPF